MRRSSAIPRPGSPLPSWWRAWSNCRRRGDGLWCTRRAGPTDIVTTGAAAARGGQPSGEQRALQEQSRQSQTEIDNLVGFIAKGTASDAVTAALTAKEAELAQIRARLAATTRPRPKIDVAEIIAALNVIGGAVQALTHATDEERRDLYNALDLRVRYDATESGPTTQ